MTGVLNSLVIPVYRNATTITEVVATVDLIATRVSGALEALFVIDGSPDRSHERLMAALQKAKTPARVITHSRNFGSFAAIRTGMCLARGARIAVMTADLQEPPDLIVEFFNCLARGEAEVVAGERASRDDRGDLASALYWRLYRRFVMREVPIGGVDVFGCTAKVRDVVCSLEETHTSLIGQLFWAGFQREIVRYDRIPHEEPSGWTFGRRLRYLTDSVFAFTDLPVRILWGVGITGLIVAVVLGAVVLVARIVGTIHVPGYAATVLIVLLFLSINSVGLGIIGSYVWRAYETAKRRPGAVVRDIIEVGSERGS